MIIEILKKMDFNIKVVEDVIDATIKVVGDVVTATVTEFKKPAIEKRLEILGKLTVYTKQLDMVLFDEAITEMYIEDFVKDHIKGKI